MNVLERLIQAFENYKNSTTFNLPKRNVPTKSIVDNEKLTALADSIRTKTGSSDGLTIDDMKTAVDNFSGGATIEKEGEYIPVPNHEEIENVYFNINMTPEEVETYLDNAGLTDIIPGDVGWSYSIFDDDYEHSISLAKFDMGGMVGYAILANTEVTFLIAYISHSLEAIAGELVPDNPFTGWNPDLVAANGVVGVNDHARTSTPSGEPSGTQNDLIAKLINIGGTEGYKKVLSGKYEPVELEINEPKKVDLTTYMDNQQMPISVNVVGGGDTNTLKKLLDATKSAKYLFTGFNGNNVDDLISYNDTENVTTMNYMFYDCPNLTTIPLLDTSSATDMNSMFYRCVRLTTIPSLDTSNVTNMGYMFNNCSSLTAIPPLDTSKVTAMNSMFSNCGKLTTIPPLDTSSVTNMDSLFSSCSNLTTISLLDTNSATNVGYVVFGCTNLTNLTLKNVKRNLQIGNGTYWGHLLTLDSLINTCKECINVGSSRTLTIGTANMAKIENIYVRFTNTDITSIELNEKGDIEECDSSAIGSMTLAQYMSLKNWSLA